MPREVRVGVFRPDDGRLADAVALLESLGATPVPDPMLEVAPTGAAPGDADFVVLTSRVAAGLLDEAGWTAGDATVCAIGASTAGALRDRGIAVDVVPDEYSSAGLVDALADRVDGRTVEVARSDHGSAVLLDGLRAAGADVTETVLYRLVRPAGAGESCLMAADGNLEAALFTSSMMVANWVDAAADRDVREAALEGLEAGVVGAIGAPTRDALGEYGLTADVVPDRADFQLLATAVVETAAPTYHD
jgi:uroporphyrinogen-III synthase